MAFFWFFFCALFESGPKQSYGRESVLGIYYNKIEILSTGLSRLRIRIWNYIIFGKLMIRIFRKYMYVIAHTKILIVVLVPISIAVLCNLMLIVLKKNDNIHTCTL